MPRRAKQRLGVLTHIHHPFPTLAPTPRRQKQRLGANKPHPPLSKPKPRQRPRLSVASEHVPHLTNTQAPTTSRRPETRLGVPNKNPPFPQPKPHHPQFAAATPRHQTLCLGVAIPIPPLLPITIHPWITQPPLPTLFKPCLNIHSHTNPNTPKRSLTSLSHTLQKLQICRPTNLAPLITSFCNSHPPYTSSLQLSSLLHIILLNSAQHTYPTLIAFSAFCFQFSAESITLLEDKQTIKFGVDSFILHSSWLFHQPTTMISIFSGPLITKKYTKSIFIRKESHQKRVLSFRKANTLKLVNKSDFEVRTEEELASGEDYPYTSFIRGTEVDFSAAKIREVLRIRHMTLGAEIEFKTRQYEDQRLDKVIRDIYMPGAQWKMSSSQPPHPIQLRRQDLTPVARGWAEFVIHSMIPTGNKSEITVARAVLIHLIIKGHDVRVEELIADNIAVLAERSAREKQIVFSKQNLQTLQGNWSAYGGTQK
ncbi:hypothetical protein PIB30_071993 [Stylosanthes scabra]|uniref:Putative plant transposon protein domain-containing protein n=1 Tax=Stylosanthes scabra TaxID=79078 RepID=A0ABU6XLS9_9FABA|nr:hypothetical protein [Stylosanthes scabra]